MAKFLGVEPHSRAKITSVNLFGIFYMAHGSCKMRWEEGGGVKEKKKGEGERWEEQKQIRA